MDWMLLPLKRYADFSGRSRRKEYWMFALFQVVVGLVLGAVAGVAYVIGHHGNNPGALFWIVVSLIFIFVLAMFIPSLAVAVRRFHDQGKSGWMVLLQLIPWIGGLIVFIFMCLDGQRGENEFGPDPKEAA